MNLNVYRTSLHAMVFIGLTFALAPIVAVGQSPREPTIVTQGCVIVDGAYVPPPYDIASQRSAVVINDRVFQPEYFGVSQQQPLVQEDRRRRGGNGPGGAFGPRGRGGMGMRRGGERVGPTQQILNDVKVAQFGATVVLFKTEKPLVLYPSNGGEQLQRALLSGQWTADSEPPSHLTEDQRDTWFRVLDEFQPSVSFSIDVQQRLDRRQMALEEGDEAVAANLLVDRISYPLTVFAMIAIALAVGHLMSDRPFAESETDVRANRTFIIKTLSMIAVFSIIDLVWTYAAANAGAMKELNPIASNLVSDPLQLTAFKVIATGTAMAVFYSLRNQRLAQLGCWWCCLLLMLLTSRWVVFQSLFT
ncbi:MAG: DUF5658 family protein [Planctomycetota bacterium]